MTTNESKNDEPNAKAHEMPAEEKEAVEAMRQAAEAAGRPLTPEEAEAAAKAARKLIEKFEPRPIDTPVYKPLS
jgi:alkanesulfonate monooxygenase SsuD/methylene tetrahydromethanopterin reductase-like flavin-dependent oxidoreductase (luciferase family)